MGEKLSDASNIAIANAIPASDSTLLCIEHQLIHAGVQWLLDMVPKLEEAIDLLKCHQKVSWHLMLHR